MRSVEIKEFRFDEASVISPRIVGEENATEVGDHRVETMSPPFSASDISSTLSGFSGGLT